MGDPYLLLLLGILQNPPILANLTFALGSINVMKKALQTLLDYTQDPNKLVSMEDIRSTLYGVAVNIQAVECLIHAGFNGLNANKNMVYTRRVHKS